MLGSGVRNLYKYTKMYSDGEPVLFEDDVFNVEVPLLAIANAGLLVNTDKIPLNIDKREEMILSYIRDNGSISNKEACQLMGLSSSSVKKIFEIMTKSNMIVQVGEKIIEDML